MGVVKLSVTRPSAGEPYSNEYSNAVRTATNRSERLRIPRPSDLRELVYGDPRRTLRM